ncbi:MAG: ABC transporter permease [Candidatus Lokiarchaeota archaeon]|nr:ABC transporter permease [Candidatus Lokiarchaeota archaeon]
MKHILQILALLCGSIFALALALIFNFFGYEHIFFGFILVGFGSVLFLIISYGLWRTREKSKLSDIKKVILWVIHNLKFLFIPGSKLDDLDERKRLHELIYPKLNRLHRYKSALFIIGISTIFLLCSIAVFQHWLSPYTFIEATTYSGLNIDIEWYYPPRPGHPLGQTFYGYDILARLIFGTRPVLLFALTATFISSLIGILIGAISGYYEGWVSAIIMRIMDLILSFPGIIFAIIFMVIWGSDFVTLIIIYSIIGIPYFARIMKSNVTKEKVLPYINAGKVAGAKNFRLLFRHILPNCLQSVIIGSSYNICRNILGLAVLGFLRYSGNWHLVSVNDIEWIEWGYDISIVLLASGRFGYAPWSVFYPSLMILIAVIGFLLLGDSLSDIHLLKQEKL